MPTSRPTHLTWLCQEILTIQPKTILDIGVGFGSKGMLFREYTDVWRGKYFKWETIIDGIEIFERYITLLQRAIYNNIYIGDAYEIIDRLRDYDLIYLGDVLEHFEKSKGRRFLLKVLMKGKVVIIATPAKVLPQQAVYNNKHEIHKSQWNEEDFNGARIAKFGNTLIAKYEI